MTLDVLSLDGKLVFNIQFSKKFDGFNFRQNWKVEFYKDCRKDNYCLFKVKI